MIPLFAIGTGPPVSASPTGTGVSAVLLDAYLRAAAVSLGDACSVRWTILAAIAQVESRNAAGRTVSESGDISPPIVGIALDGSGATAAIRDTDDGSLDGDVVWDRAVGPMQFIPSSWATFGRDGDGDGKVNPHNIYDAALAAAAHLCLASPGDYDIEAELATALRRYNNSASYVLDVLGWVAHFDALDVSSRDKSPLAGRYTLPVDRSWFEARPEWFSSTHHDYAAADLPMPVGTVLYAVTDGRVRATTSAETRCGLGVVLAGDDEWDYVYCHLSELAVSAGDSVRVGGVVGASGNTGRSTGPHLHFGVQTPAERRVCPQPILEAWFRGRAVDAGTVDGSSCIG